MLRRHRALAWNSMSGLLEDLRREKLPHEVQWGPPML
jgi:hypothetical protein